MPAVLEVSFTGDTPFEDVKLLTNSMLFLLRSCLLNSSSNYDTVLSLLEKTSNEVERRFHSAVLTEDERDFINSTNETIKCLSLYTQFAKSKLDSNSTPSTLFDDVAKYISTQDNTSHSLLTHSDLIKHVASTEKLQPPFIYGYIYRELIFTEKKKKLNAVLSNIDEKHPNLELFEKAASLCTNWDGVTLTQTAATHTREMLGLLLQKSISCLSITPTILTPESTNSIYQKCEFVHNFVHDQDPSAPNVSLQPLKDAVSQWYLQYGENKIQQYEKVADARKRVEIDNTPVNDRPLLEKEHVATYLKDDELQAIKDDLFQIKKYLTDKDNPKLEKLLTHYRRLELKHSKLLLVNALAVIDRNNDEKRELLKKSFFTHLASALSILAAVHNYFPEHLCSDQLEAIEVLHDYIDLVYPWLLEKDTNSPEIQTKINEMRASIFEFIRLAKQEIAEKPSTDFTDNDKFLHIHLPNLYLLAYCHYQATAFSTVHADLHLNKALQYANAFKETYAKSSLETKNIYQHLFELISKTTPIIESHLPRSLYLQDIDKKFKNALHENNIEKALEEGYKFVSAYKAGGGDAVPGLLSLTQIYRKLAVIKRNQGKLNEAVFDFEAAICEKKADSKTYQELITTLKLQIQKAPHLAFSLRSDIKKHEETLKRLQSQSAPLTASVLPNSHFASSSQLHRRPTRPPIEENGITTSASTSRLDDDAKRQKIDKTGITLSKSVD